MDHSNAHLKKDDSMDFRDIVEEMEKIEEEPVPSVSIPLEEGDELKQMDLDEFAKQLAQELFRVKSIVNLVSIEEIGARIEECKVAMSMYSKLFEILVQEHTKRMNTSSNEISEIGEICDKTE